MAKTKPLSQRQLRVGELVRHAVTDVLARAEFYDDEILKRKLICVSQVKMSADLKIATCFLSVLDKNAEQADSADCEKIVNLVRQKVKLIRMRATPLLRSMKYMPDFRFLPDTGFESFARIDALLKSEKVRRDLAKPASEPQAEPQAQPQAERRANGA